jgi:PE family
VNLLTRGAPFELGVSAVAAWRAAAMVPPNPSAGERRWSSQGVRGSKNWCQEHYCAADKIVFNGVVRCCSRWPKDLTGRPACWETQLSFLNAVPQAVLAAAADLAGIGSVISDANSAAAAPTTGALAPGADGVSAAIAALFDSHAQTYQTISAQASTFHAQFVQMLTAGANQYASAEAANALPLQAAQQGAQALQQAMPAAVSAPAQSLLAQPATLTAAATPVAQTASAAAPAAQAAAAPALAPARAQSGSRH